MSSPCLGCGTTTDENGDLTILGARSSSWKTRYGPNIDEVNGLRCDPTSGKLWVHPPAKMNTWTVGPGTFGSGLSDSQTYDALNMWVGEGPVTRVPAGESQIVPSLSDPQDINFKRYVATGGTLNWTNSTAEDQLVTVTTFARLGAGTLYAGYNTISARGFAGVETMVNINNEGANSRTIEHGVYHGSSLTASLAQVYPFYVTVNNCSRVDLYTVEAGQTLAVSLRPYFRSDFGDIRAMTFIFDRAPRAVVRAESLFRHSDNLDAT